MTRRAFLSAIGGMVASLAVPRAPKKEPTFSSGTMALPSEGWRIEIHEPNSRERVSQAKRKSFCNRGHPLTDETTYDYGHGRMCKLCVHIRGKRRPRKVAA